MDGININVQDRQAILCWPLQCESILTGKLSGRTDEKGYNLKRERERDRQTDRQTDRQRQRVSDDMED